MAFDPRRQAGHGRPLNASDESIDEASDESFPASDPPSTWSGGDPEPDGDADRDPE
jgi:hypothetical protein